MYSAIVDRFVRSCDFGVAVFLGLIDSLPDITLLAVDNNIVYYRADTEEAQQKLFREWDALWSAKNDIVNKLLDGSWL